MKWITPERPKIDRIACPWLIKTLDAIPFDIAGTEYTHQDEYCTNAKPGHEGLRRLIQLG